MKEKYAVIIDHYIVINEKEKINLKDKKGKVIEETEERIKVEIEDKIYDLPKEVVVQVIK